MARVLLVDDDRYVLRALQTLIMGEGHHCVTVACAAEAGQALRGDPFDLVLLDVGLPDGDGFSLCRQIRTRFRMPILLLTARSNTADKVVGLEVGADDYLTKPFEPRELVARVRAHLRRATEYAEPAEAANQIRVGDLIIDVDRRDAFRHGAPLHLTTREFELLHLLARHRDKALAATWIFESVWGYEPEAGMKTLAVFVSRLRQKIEADPLQPRMLLNVRGFGYKITGDP